MMEELGHGVRVYIIPVQKYGTISHQGDLGGWWVDYEDEYGGLFWDEQHLINAEKHQDLKDYLSSLNL